MSHFEASLSFYHISVLRVELHNLRTARPCVDVLQESLQDVLVALSLALHLLCRLEWRQLRN